MWRSCWRLDSPSSVRKLSRAFRFSLLAASSNKLHTQGGLWAVLSDVDIRKVDFGQSFLLWTLVRKVDFGQSFLMWTLGRQILVSPF